MRSFKGLNLVIVILALALLIVSGQAFGQPSQGNREFGLGQPASVSELPAGLLRSRLESLPPQARSAALLSLQSFSFPETDLDLLQVDDHGGIFYSDTELPGLVDEQSIENAAPVVPGAVPQSTLDAAFLLHSKPSSPNVVYLDFNGELVSGRAWNSAARPVIDAVPFNLDSDESSFSNAERLKIVDVWHRMAEDLAAFDIDVTTERPASFNNRTGHIVVTHNLDRNGAAITCTSCGGTAYVNVFGGSNNVFYSPGWVYFNKLGNAEWNIAEAGSHEFGHNLGLSHDGTSTTGYYAGLGSDSNLVSWAPIMGVGYYKNVTQWSKGEYPDANNTQDDLAIIDGKLGYRTDDHGDTRASATPLFINGSGGVVASNPALDPDNVLFENKGVIDTSTDVDVFSFVSGAGDINLTVNPAWDAFYRPTNHRGANLDIDIELQNNSGTPIDFDDPLTETNASVSATVAAGTYYLLVTGVGNPVTPYYAYASQGMYFINGTVPVASPDNTAPTPNPMTWASLPGAISDTAISMTATTATDDISSVEYLFECTLGGSGCTSSGWQSSSSYTASSLAPNTSYTFQVTARDQAHNETAPSGAASATTNPPPPPPADPTGFSAIAVSETAISLLWTDNATDETGYRLERSPGGQNSFAIIATLAANSSSHNDSGLTASTAYDYRVSAFRSSDFSGFATASATTDDPPPPPTSVDYFSNSGSTVAGSASGSHTNTHDDDGTPQSITEQESGGKPSNRYSYLEYRWSFSISAGATATVYANAWSEGSSDGDTFNFEYSLNNGASFAPMFNVSSISSGNLQSFELPGAPGGSILIRVVDSNRTSGNRNLDTVVIDHLFIQVGNPSTEPPDGGPTGLGATAISSSRIDLSWSNGSTNESGLKVERSLAGGGPWTEVADLAAGTSSYSDIGLTAETHYYYQVYAYNPNGVSASVFADATTLVAPAIVLSASGYKSKGIKHVSLSWTGSSSVDVYRDGNPVPVASGVSGNSYDDNLNEKGSGTHTHQVCDAGTTTCSNVTTTIF